ncbi:MAG: serine/threonine protein kinase [Deltaproteobacteria bacterium]|nr:serine/threonine protein kinase [Deltaproteobacteria bacterium]
MSTTARPACPSPELFDRLAAGAITDDERGALLDHAAGCDACHAALTVILATQSTAPRAGAVAEHEPRLDRYVLGRELGRGAMGVVYAARDPELDREVAIKVLRDGASAERLRREAQALARLAHPNVVRVYDVGQAGDQTFVAMELVRGENLRGWLRAPRTPAAITEVLRRAGLGLAAAHDAGLVHRDFKPDNVLLSDAGDVLVGDFGLAFATAPAPDAASVPGAPAPSAANVRSSDTLTETGALVGTPAYMAPEQAAGDASPASDQYAFCVTAWEAYFGYRPMAGAPDSSLADGAQAYALARKAGRGPARAIEAALRRGLSLRPSARFASMPLLLRAIAPPTRARWPWLVGGAILAATATTAIVLTRGSAPPIDCAQTAGLVAPTWAEPVRAKVAAQWGAALADGLGRYARAWQGRRVEACRATHERGEQTVATLEKQVGCLERARAALGATIDALATAAPGTVPNPAGALENLPSLERCTGVDAVAAPPADRAAAIAALDDDLTRLELGLDVDRSSLTLAETSARRAHAESLGYPPQIRRALLLEARVAAWSGERTTAEAVFRQLVVLAERDADDFTRAHALALLARLLADRQTEEADHLASQAGAALARAGADPRIALAVALAEVAVARARGDHAGASARQQRVVELVRARSGEGEALVTALADLEQLASAAGDAKAVTDADAELVQVVTRKLAGSPLAEAASTQQSSAALAQGDYRTAIPQLQRFIALRDVPGGLRDRAHATSTLANAYFALGDYRGAADAFRASVELWSRPAAEFAVDGAVHDRVEATDGVLEGLTSEALALLQLGRAAEAVPVAREAYARAQAEAVAIDRVALASRVLGLALADAGAYREARGLLEPAVAAVTPSSPPLSRARLRFAFARALWEDGGIRDRARAHALATDALADIPRAIEAAKDQPLLRPIAGLARETGRQIEAWLTAHPAP